MQLIVQTLVQQPNPLFLKVRNIFITAFFTEAGRISIASEIVKSVSDLDCIQYNYCCEDTQMYPAHVNQQQT